MNPANKNNEKDENNNDCRTIPTAPVHGIDEEGERQKCVSDCLYATQATLVLTYLFLCVEIGDGILCSDRDLDFAENPTVLEYVEFHSNISDLEKLELQRLKDMALCDE
jgi:hypothetical protein